MRWQRIGVIAAIVLVAGAFLAGYLPEHRSRTATEQQSAALREQLAVAEAHVRMGRLLGQALTLKEVVMRQNYGQAQELSSAFFDDIRAEVSTTPILEFRELLTQMLTRRDFITAGLTKADTEVAEVLHMIESGMREALGYPLPPEFVARLTTAIR